MHCRRQTLAALFVCLMLLVFSPTVMSAQAQPSATASTQQHSKPLAYTLPPEKLKVAVEYTHKRTVLGLAQEGWGIVQLLLLLVLGVAAWMRRVAVGVSQNKWAQGFTFFFLFSAITTLLSLPLDMLRHQNAVEYGQSVQHWGSWFGDQAKSFLLSYLVGGLLVMLLFFVIGKSPNRWWFWFWIPAVLSSVFGFFISPIFIDPLFNHFEPLTKSNPALVEQLERVVNRGGIDIPPDRMFLMKASEKWTGLNAYVTGIGASKRVVVWDTSIAKATPDEIAFIFGHEMGHYVLNHIYKGLACAAVGLLVMFWVGYHCVQWLIKRFGPAWGVSEQHNWAAFIVIMFVFSALSFLSEPIGNAYFRSHEHDADVYGQEAIHGIVGDPETTAANAFQVLGEESLDDPTPRPFVEFWTFNHPSIASRLAFAAIYDPWVDGKEPKYFKK